MMPRFLKQGAPLSAFVVKRSKFMKIGTLDLDNITILAPLAGITNLPFRLLAKEAGCALVFTEMISSNGLVRKDKKTIHMMSHLPEEKPIAIQLFGHDPSVMAEAAAIAQLSGADIIDINMGCPVKKVLKTGAGAALMKLPEKIEAMLKAVRKSITIPLTIKLRSGWDSSGVQAIEIARIAEDCGTDAVTIHPRTVSQGFSGVADWSKITAIKKQSSIPVIGNGDIHQPEDALRMKTVTGCDGIMIGRAAVGNPWIFSQVLALLNGNEIPQITHSEHFSVMTRYLNISIQHFGEQRACKMMRSRLGWFAKGLPNASKFRESIKHISSEKQAIELIETYRQSISNL
jgi:tRNA-dihydrouridine synthase B